MANEIDWRAPENRREMFLRMYGWNLEHRTHTELAYLWLPAIADTLDLDADERAWLAWIQGNTQNPVTTWAIFQEAPVPWAYEDAIKFWADNYDSLAWDTDRRYFKRHFGTATRAWAEEHAAAPVIPWQDAGLVGWPEVWRFATSLPYMGRLSAWSLVEYHRLLLGEDIPDADSFLFDDVNGSHSHRNGAAFVAGYDSVFWSKTQARDTLDIDWLEEFADGLMEEARQRYPHRAEHVTRYTMESALCEFKLWMKPNQRYANVYADLGHRKLLQAEGRLGQRFELLWDARRALPSYARLEDMPHDPGVSRVKQNQYRLTGQPVMLCYVYEDMPSAIDWEIVNERTPIRRDK